MVSSPNPGSPSSVICVVGSPGLGPCRPAESAPALPHTSKRIREHLDVDRDRVRLSWLSPKEQWEKMARKAYPSPLNDAGEVRSARKQSQTPMSSQLPPRSTSLYALAPSALSRPLATSHPPAEGSCDMPSSALAAERKLRPHSEPHFQLDPDLEVVSSPTTRLELRWEPDPEQREYDEADRAWEDVERMMGRMVREPSVQQRGQWVWAKRSDKSGLDLGGEHGEVEDSNAEGDHWGEIVNIYMEDMEQEGANENEEEETKWRGEEGRHDMVATLAPTPINTPIPVATNTLGRLRTLPSRARREVDEESCITFTGGMTRSDAQTSAQTIVPARRASRLSQLDSHVRRTLRALQEDDGETLLCGQIDE